MATLTWKSGGRSIDALSLDGWFSFTVPVGCTGIVVGLNPTDASADPAEIKYGLSFAAGQVRVIEGGVNKTALMAYAGETCHVARVGNTVYYCLGDAPAAVPGLWTELPGAVIYTSTTLSAGDMYLDASLLAEGDEVAGAALTNVTGGAVFISFEPMEVYASQGESARVGISFEPMEVTIGFDASVSISFEPMQVFAAEAQSARANIAFEPMEVTAYPGTVWAGNAVNIAFEPMQAFAASGGTVNEGEINISFETMAVYASETEGGRVNIAFEPMFVYASGGSTALTPYFAFNIPAFGNSPDFPTVEEVGEALDEVFTGEFRMVEDIGEALDILSYSSITHASLEDVGVGSDSTAISASWLVEDEAEGLDEIVYTGTILLVEEVGEALDEISAAGPTEASVEDVAEASDAAFASSAWSVEEIGEALDETAIASVAFLEDIGEALDEVYGNGVTSMLVEDIGEALDEVAYTSISTQTVEEVAEAEDSILLRNPNLIAWVMNTETGGVAWYENWSFTGMCVVGGKVLAIGPEGLAVVGGNTDAGTRINARVAFGFTDFSGYTDSGTPKNSDPQRKRVESYWFGYHSTGVLNAAVETFGQSTYTYTMAPRPANSPRNNRIVPGKGLNARFWRITLANTAGCAFEVNSMAADIARSSRRL